MKLYFTRNYNPRLAVATARHLNAPVEYEYATLFDPKTSAAFIKLNPNQRAPILVEGERVTWEADAIACRLSQIMKSDFWPTGDALPELIRWLSWGYWNFVCACDLVHFERVTKQRYGHGPIEQNKVDEGLAEFASASKILNEHLNGKQWLLGDHLTYADFRLACVLPFANLAGLPLADYPVVEQWHNRLLELEAWRDPFKGLTAPELPPIAVSA